MSKIWSSDDWFGNVPERNQHLNKLIYCILFQIIFITSTLCFFASNYCFLSCWLTIIISPGINLIWNNCMFPFALSTLRIICPASLRNNALSLPLIFRISLWIFKCWQVPTYVQAFSSPKQWYESILVSIKITTLFNKMTSWHITSQQSDHVKKQCQLFLTISATAVFSWDKTLLCSTFI